jgi:hypothetical protein
VRVEALAGLYDELITLVLRPAEFSCIKTLNHFSALEKLSNPLLITAILQQSPIHIELCEDHFNEYAEMDHESQCLYLDQIERIAACAVLPSIYVARTAINIAAERKVHVGRVIFGASMQELLCELAISEKSCSALAMAESREIIGSSLVGVSLAVLASSVTSPGVLSAALFLPFSLVLSSAAWRILDTRGVHALNVFAMSADVGKRALDKVVVCIPLLLSKEHQVDIVLENLARYGGEASRGSVAIIADFPDSEEALCTDNELSLLDYLVSAAERSARLLDTNICVLYRERTFSQDQGKYVGWERKRGKLEEFGRYMRDIRTSLSLLTGCKNRLRKATYALVLDEDSKLMPNCITELLSIALHPLNKPVLDSQSRNIVSGIGLVFPTSIAWSKALSGQPLSAPFPMPSRFRKMPAAPGGSVERSYSGKGLYDIRVYDQVLSYRLPENLILSHDVVESAFLKPLGAVYARVAESLPDNLSALSQRQHRWYRGDFQNFAFLMLCVLHRSGADVLIRHWDREVLVRVLMKTLKVLTMVANPFLILSLLIISETVKIQIIVLGILILAPPIAIRTVKLIAHQLAIDRESLLLSFRREISGFAMCLHWSAVAMDAMFSSILALYQKKHRLDWITAFDAGENHTQRKPLTFAIFVFLGLWSTLMVGFAPVTMSVLLLWLVAPYLRQRWEAN